MKLRSGHRRLASVLVALTGLLLGACEAAEVAPIAPEADGGSADVAEPPEDGAVADTSSLPEPTGPMVLWPSSSAEYIGGGLLGTYVIDYGIEDLEDVPLDAEPTHLERSLALTNEDPLFHEAVIQGNFGLLLQGAIYIEETDVYRVAAATHGLLDLRIDGLPVFELTDAGEIQSGETSLQLEAGWHPLTVRYVRKGYTADLFVYLAPIGELVQPMEDSTLGYALEPPAGVPELEGSYEHLFTWSYGSRFGFEASVPASLVATTVVNGEEIQVASTGDPAKEGSLAIPLAPDDDYEISVELVDIWERSISQDPTEITTPPTPPYVVGGLLGSYYQGKNFNNLVDLRFDPQVNLPLGAGDTPNGNFGTTLPNNNFSVRWEGAIWVEDAGEYSFYLGTNDGGRLTLDGETVIDNWLDHSFLSFEGTTQTLYRGWHTLMVEMYEGGGESAARLDWEGPDFSRAVVPPHKLGTLMPEESSSQPEILDFSVNPNNDGITISYKTDKLVTAMAEVTILQNDPMTLNFPLYATGGKDMLEEVRIRCVAATAKLYVTDMAGQTNTSDSIPVPVNTGDCQDDN